MTNPPPDDRPPNERPPFGPVLPPRNKIVPKGPMGSPPFAIHCNSPRQMENIVDQFNTYTTHLLRITMSVNGYAYWGRIGSDDSCVEGDEVGGRRFKTCEDMLLAILTGLPCEDTYSIQYTKENKKMGGTIVVIYRAKQ